jgi:hypothetical protein
MRSTPWATSLRLTPTTRPAAAKKRTALGRYAHESGAFSLPVAGKPLAVYMGDDARNEYIYKFVSAANWDAADANSTDVMATGDKYLDSGKLYVAKFNSRWQWPVAGAELEQPDGGGLHRLRFCRPGRRECQHPPGRRLPWVPPRWTAPSGARSTRPMAKFISR